MPSARYTRNLVLEDRKDRRWHERLLLAHPFLNRFAACCGQVVLTALIWPRFVAPYRWELTRREMPLRGVDAAFNGYRILQLSDFHVGQTRQSYLERVVDRCLEEKPDLVVITGDLIDYEPKALRPVGGLLKRIAAGAGADGVCVIFGNHDYHEYSWRHVGARAARRAIHKRLVGIIEDAGITLLRNEQKRIRRGAGELIIVGMDEMWTGRADAAAAFRGIEAGAAVVCLQHNPDGVEFLAGYPWQWMLCGHSHGGQAKVPVLGTLYVPMVHKQYLEGAFEFPPAAGQGTGFKRTMYVSRGLGYTTPIRMHCRPEATVFRVVKSL
jgi:predicted MPP superfamily phosphohydrolase